MTLEEFELTKSIKKQMSYYGFIFENQFYARTYEQLLLFAIMELCAKFGKDITRRFVSQIIEDAFSMADVFKENLEHRQLTQKS